jgi:hypothetical protein
MGARSTAPLCSCVRVSLVEEAGHRHTRQS